jgi:hypothetical protein
MYERHFDFNQRALFLYPIQQQDKNRQYFDTSTFGNALGAQLVTEADGSTGYWPTASNIRTVTKVYAPANAVTGDYMFDLRYQLTLFDFFGLYYNQSGTPSGPIAAYMESMSYVKLVEDVFNYPMSYTYTRTTDRLFLDTDYTKLITGNLLFVETYVQIDTEKYPKVWNDRVFKKYYTALLKKQWAQNLIKFSNVPLPGGASLNAPAILSEANRELGEVELFLTRTQELPVDPLIG